MKEKVKYSGGPLEAASTVTPLLSYVIGQTMVTNQLPRLYGMNNVVQ
ncbi:MAG: hypothetical protein M3146_08845 [Thermoproteota archaeon]|nr:hypothetical protein [Thermoproteota archaeon]